MADPERFDVDPDPDPTFQADAVEIFVLFSA